MRPFSPVLDNLFSRNLNFCDCLWLERSIQATSPDSAKPVAGIGFWSLWDAERGTLAASMACRDPLYTLVCPVQDCKVFLAFLDQLWSSSVLTNWS